MARFLEGFIVFDIPEPIGSVPPKINNINDKFQLMQVKLESDFAMQCPGQAYPVPVVRWVSLCYFVPAFQMIVFQRFVVIK